MLISLVEFQGRQALLSHLDLINKSGSSAWGIVALKRAQIKNITNEVFLLMVKPALGNATEARIFVLENGDLYVAWQGMLKRVYGQLKEIAQRMLLKDDADTDASVTYIDPLVRGDELVIELRVTEKKAVEPPPAAAPAPITKRELMSKPIVEEEPMKPNAKQADTYSRAKMQKGERKKLDILVVEDQPFLRKMLKQLLAEAHEVQTAAGMNEGWEIFLNKAPDIVFLDIGLEDGNGHVLANSIKKLDPATYVVMVTAHNQEDELRTAIYNRVDGYVVKPYNRQQISGYIGKYMNARKLLEETRGYA